MQKDIGQLIESSLPPQATDLRQAWFAWKERNDDTGLFYALECSPRSMGFRIGLLWLSLFHEPLHGSTNVQVGHWIRWLRYHLSRTQFSPPDRYYVPSNNAWGSWVYMAGWTLMQSSLLERQRLLTTRYLEHGALSWYSLWRFSQNDPVLYHACLGSTTSPVQIQGYDFYRESVQRLPWQIQDPLFWTTMDNAWVLFQSDESMWRDWLLMQRAPIHTSLDTRDLNL